MTQVKFAASLLMSYALVLIANAVLYYSWSGDASEFPRLALRVAGFSFIANGLRRGLRWAWWLSVVIGGILASLGLLGSWLAIRGNLLVERPYPTLDLAVSITAAGLLLVAVILLLLPRSRAVFRSAARSGGEAGGLGALAAKRSGATSELGRGDT